MFPVPVPRMAFPKGGAFHVPGDYDLKTVLRISLIYYMQLKKRKRKSMVEPIENLLHGDQLQEWWWWTEVQMSWWTQGPYLLLMKYVFRQKKPSHSCLAWKTGCWFGTPHQVNQMTDNPLIELIPCSGKYYKNFLNSLSTVKVGFEISWVTTKDIICFFVVIPLVSEQVCIYFVYMPLQNWHLLTCFIKSLFLKYWCWTCILSAPDKI